MGGMHARLLQEHSELHVKHAQDLEELEDSVEKQARSIVEERFNCLDKELEASVGKHARLLQEHSDPHGEQDQGLSESHDYRERAEKRRQRLENLLLRYAGAEQE